MAPHLTILVLKDGPSETFFIFKSSLFTSSHMSKTVYKIVQPDRANKYINTHTGDVVYDFVYILDSREYCFSK